MVYFYNYDIWISRLLINAMNNRIFTVEKKKSLDMKLSKNQIIKALINLRRYAGWSATLLFANPEDRFSHVEAHIM